ncbi:WD40 repeat domain-containing protein [Candidatus Villigracilis affinis]
MTHDNVVNSIAFSLDGKYVVSGSDDATAVYGILPRGGSLSHDP